MKRGRRRRGNGRTLVTAPLLLSIVRCVVVAGTTTDFVREIAFSVDVNGGARDIRVSHDEDVGLMAKTFCDDIDAEDKDTCATELSFHVHSLFADQNANLENYDRCLVHYEKMLTLSPNHRDVMVRVGKTYEQMDDLDRAVGTYKEVIAAHPNDAFARLAVATVFHRVGMMDDAIEYYVSMLEIAEAFPNAATPNDVQLVHNNLGLAYLALGRTDQSVHHLMRAAKYEQEKPSDDETASRHMGAKQYLLSDLMAREGNLVGAAEMFMNSIRSDASLLNINEVAREALLKSVGVLGNQSTNGVHFRDDAAAPQLVIFAPLKAVYGDGTWGPSSVDTTGIGGSEESVIFLSRELVRQGFVVRVYCYLKPGDAGRDAHDVQWLPIQLFDPDLEIADVFVSWRSYRGLLLGKKSTARYLWLHLKVDGERLLNPDVLHAADGVFLVSQRERDRITEAQQIELDRHGVDLIVTKNGLDASYFVEGDVSRVEPRFIYASQPNYGLEWLLQIWPLVLRDVPNAILDVFGDYPGEYKVMNGASIDPYEKMRERERVLEMLQRLPGVHAHGMVDQRVLSEAFATSSFWLYPTSTPETSCITAMRAQALGAIPITSRFANSALPQTCGRFDLGPHSLTHHEWSNNDEDVDREARVDFAKAIVDATQMRPADLARHRSDMQEWARREFSWRRVAKQWALEFAKKLSRKHSADALHLDQNRVDSTAPTFTFIWTTPPATFTLRCRRAIESALFHHPDATVLLYSNSLSEDMFAHWRDTYGYDIVVRRYEIRDMIRRSQIASSHRVLLESFFSVLEKQPIRYPNVEADLIRLLALLDHGGVYLDLDAIVLRPLHTLRNSAAWEGDVPTTLLSMSQCASHTGTTCTIGNAVLAFDAGNRFLEACLVAWLEKYTRTSGRLNWEYAGEVLTDTFWSMRERDPTFGTSESEDDSLRVLSRKSFYYYGQFGWGRFFNRQPDERRQLGRLLRESYVAHFWNHVHTYHLPETGSLMYHVLNDFRLQIGDPSTGAAEDISTLVVSPYDGK